MSQEDHGGLRVRLVQLRARLDDHFAAAVARQPEAYACRRGCSACCQQRLSVFAVEADAVRCSLRELSTRDPAIRSRIREQAASEAEGCPLLVDDMCSIYDARPLMCRAHGLPTAVPIGNDGLRVDVCPLNFASPDQEPANESVLMLSAVNEPLAMLAQMWDGRGERVELVTLALEDSAD